MMTCSACCSCSRAVMRASDLPWNTPNLGYGCRPSGFIEAMVVAASHRRRGVARQILRRVLTDAAAAGCHKIQLLAHKRHATDGAHDFYRSMGFEPEAEGFRLYLGGDR